MKKALQIVRNIGIHALLLAVLLSVVVAPKVQAQGPAGFTSGVSGQLLAIGGPAGGSGVSGAGGSNCDSQHFCNPIKATSLAGLLDDLLKVLTAIGSVVVVFFLILAGFNYVTARGDEKKIQSATKTFTWTAVGAAVILGAQVISRAIQGTVNQLGTGGTGAN